MSIKPHAGDDIAEIQNVGGTMRIRFTPAWYRYFDSIDRDIAVTVTQNISNNSITFASSALAGVSVDIDELKRELDSIRAIVARLQAAQFVEEKDFSAHIAQLMSMQQTESPSQSFSVTYAEQAQDWSQQIDARAPRNHTHSPEEVGAYDRRVKGVNVSSDYTLSQSTHLQFSQLTADVNITIPAEASVNLGLPNGEIYTHYIHTGSSTLSQITRPDLSTVALSANTIYTLRKSITSADSWLITSDGVT